MKILILNFEYPPLGGGGGVATQKFAEELANRHEVHVLTTDFKELVAEEVGGGVYIHRVRVIGRKSLPTASLISLLMFAPAALWRGIRLCRDNKFDVINAQFVVPSGLPAVVLAKMFKLPFVLSFIGGDVFDPSKSISPHRYGFLRWLIRWIGGQAQGRTAISDDTRKRAHNIHKVAGEIVVTHLGVDEWEGEFQNPDIKDQRYFVSIGRLIPRKGYDVLLEAWREVDCELVIMGSGPLEKILLEKINDLGLRGRVRLAGFVSEDQKRKILQGATGYVSAADHEGFGIVFLEAMQAGLPIVATDTGGQTDFLTEGENALLVRPRDVKALAWAVGKILEDDELRQTMKKNNLEQVKNFYWAKTAERFERVLLDAVKKYESSN